MAKDPNKPSVTAHSNSDATGDPARETPEQVAACTLQEHRSSRGPSSETVRETIERSIGEVRAKEADAATTGKSSTATATEVAATGYSGIDGAVLAVSELLFLLFGLPFGDDLYHDKPIPPLHWIYLAIAVTCAIAGPMWPTISNRWTSPTISALIARTARDARLWIAVLLIFFLYGVAPGIYRRASAPVAATTCWDGKAPPCDEQSPGSPSTEDLAKALENSRQQGAIVADQLGAALIERDKLKSQLIWPKKN